MALLASISTTILFAENTSWYFSIFGGVWFKGIAGLLSVIIALLFHQIQKKFILESIFYLLCLLCLAPLYISNMGARF
jgi:hypothetical protein